MHVALSGVNSLGFVTLLAFNASPVTRYKMLCDVFRCLQAVFLGGIPVPAEHRFG